MNAGMYGMANGQGMAGRKLAGRVGFQITNSAAVVEQFFASSGLLANALSVTAGVRTKLLATNGRGALRWLGLSAGVTGGVTYKFEVIVDGVPVINATYTSGASKGPCVWGGMSSYPLTAGGTQAVPTLDYMPFDSSLEVYVTAGSTEVTNGYFYLVDLHQ